MARAGNLREPVMFQRYTEAADAYGNTVQDWADHLARYADVLETPGREGLAAGRVESTRTATMRIRRDSQTLALTAADRVICRGKKWNIRAIGEVSRDRTLLELVIEAGVAA
jgi:SPP1 family predicted phage head-tail adaptor